MNREALAERLLATFLGELEEQVRVMNAELLTLEQNHADADCLRALFRVAHTLKGAARAAGVPLVERACHALETELAKARDGALVLGPEEFQLYFTLADALKDARERLKSSRDLGQTVLSDVCDRLLARSESRVSGPTAPRAEASDAAPASVRGASHVRVHTQKLDALLASSAQLKTGAGRVAGRARELRSFHDSVDRWATDWRRIGRRVRLALEKSGAPSSVARAAAGLEEVLQRLVQDAGRLAGGAESDARALSRGVNELHGGVGRLRMRPFAEACEALPRVVRDLAHALSKEARIEIAGGDVEADRTVLDGLRDALVQLVRNAVDHGIELPEVRARAGKPRQGVVAVSAALEGDHLTVAVSDDGAGLDAHAIRARFEQRGIPFPADERDLGRVLLSTGLSTRKEVTEISGRGVGMDIVRTAVERIRGNVSVTWTAGRGTRFAIECPPSVATVRSVLAEVGSQVVAIPTVSVERLLRLKPEEIRHVEGREVIAAGERPAPLIALARLLSPLVERPVSGAFPVVLLRAGDRRLAVAVDALLDETEVLLRPLGGPEQSLPHVSGAALLDSGRVALVLDPAAVIAAGLGVAAASGVTVAETKTESAARPRIVVVDDSITTRTLEQSVLEAAGYDVRTAVDGADGWQAVQEFAPDLVVADIEMPRMDGFALCEAIRASKRFKSLPLVLVTALETPEHRARGLEVGADAFIGKSSFDQAKLLDAIQQLLG